MRRFLTIIRYELLMHLKAAHFKALMPVIILQNIWLFQNGMQGWALNASESILEFHAVVVYLCIAAVVGMYSIGRLRKTGMHPLLMTRPFSTFTLVSGQAAAATLFLAGLSTLILFPANMLLHVIYMTDFSPGVRAFVLLFYLLPSFAVVVTLSLWVRTCFKNNIMAMIILGIMFFAMLTSADRLAYVYTSDKAVHNFIPLMSSFSSNYWNEIKMYEDTGHLNLLEPRLWGRMGLTALLCFFFLQLCGYHLRRTEPHRKVLGSYGSRFYHAPTFARMAFDLKIDPHITFRSHILLAAVFLIVLSKIFWPVLSMIYTRTKVMKAMRQNENVLGEDRVQKYNAQHLSENMLLPVRIHRTESFVSPDYMKTRMTISCDADTSGTVAVLGFPHPYTLKKMLLEDKPVLFYPGNDSCYYIEGAQFASICDGREREVLLEYDGTNITRENPMMMNYSTWPEKFITKRKRIDNGMGGSGYMWDWFHTEAWPHVVEIANAWPDPPVLSYITPVKVGDRSHRRQGALSFLKKSLNVWRFEIPKELAYASSDVIFSFNGPGRDAFFSLPDSSRNIRFFCDKSYERDARECLEVLQPVIEEFCGLYGIGETARINVNLPTHILKQIRIGKIQYIRYSRYSGNSQWLLGNITSNIFSVQTQILNDLFWQRMRFLGLFGKYTKELQSFLNNNMTRGLNHAFSPDQTFLPPAFSPTPRHLDDKLLRQQGATPRKMWENRSVTPPVFQMLYLVMGHDAWIQMLKLLREGVEEHNQDETFIQTCAEQAWEQPLDWFFDFWMNSDLEFPRYRLDKAEARILEQGDEDQTRYELTVVLANETGGRMPVPLVIETAISRMENKVWVGAGETVSWSIVIREVPVKVMVDPDGWILTTPRWDEKLKASLRAPWLPVTILKEGDAELQAPPGKG